MCQSYFGRVYEYYEHIVWSMPSLVEEIRTRIHISPLSDEQMETEELESNSKLHELWLQREREAQAAWNAKQSFLRRQEKLREEEQVKLCQPFCQALPPSYL